MQKMLTYLERFLAALPTGVTVRRTGSSLSLTYRWFSLTAVLAAVFLIPFGLIWNGFLVVWYAKLIITPPPTDWTLWFVPLPHLVVGLFIIYFAIANLINYTSITVERGRLEVCHAPLPWWGQRRLLVSDITQVYVKRKPGRKKVTYSVLCPNPVRPGGEVGRWATSR